MSTTKSVRQSMREIFDNIERALSYRDVVQREMAKIDVEIAKIDAQLETILHCESGAQSSHSAGLAPSPSSPVVAGPPYPNCHMPGACTVRGYCCKDPNCAE